jgi:hypothetical protein
MATSLDFSRRWQLARPLLAAYWLAVAAALVLLALARPDSTALDGVWLGAVAGGLLGNLLALCNLRLWLAVVVALMATPFLIVPGTAFAHEAQLSTTFVPALICGYLLLGRRATLAAFWFPAMLFSVTLIDRLDGDNAAAGLDARALVMQALIALGFMLLLAMFERRRIALWHSVGNVAHVAGTVRILREPAGRGAARAGWSLATVALTAGLTAWIAPRLWRGEHLDGRVVAQPSHGGGVALAHGLPCCPVAVREPRARVREYLDVARGVAHAPPQPGVTCQQCNGAVAGNGFVPAVTAGVSGGVALPVANAAPAAVAGNSTAPITTVPPMSTPPVLPPSPARPSQAAPVATAPAPTVAPLARPAAPPSPLPSATTAAPAPSPPSAAAPAPEVPAVPTPGDDSFTRWLLSLLLAVALVTSLMLLLRPLRRAVTLRHLRRPYWPESLPQRISNFWQLALIGLRDAGVHAGASERPEDLAARAPVADVNACAAILARARHGLGLDDGDLEAMRAAAESTFATARRRISFTARAASWLRWPLS